MKLGTLRGSSRDGRLVIVNRHLTRMIRADDIAPTLQTALERWSELAPILTARYDALCRREITADEPFVVEAMESPLPRSYQWADGSAYLEHMRLVRRARGADLPPRFETDPLLYQGGSDGFLAPTSAIPLIDEAWGLDFEAEVAVITDDVPVGSPGGSHHIALVMLCNDVSLRNVMRPELEKGFGFFQSKPASAFSPVAVTPDELGNAWDGSKVSLPLISTLNHREFGRPNAGTDLYFTFPELIRHATLTRSLSAGTIIGSGTVSNTDRSTGCSCIAERRMIETLTVGTPLTAFLKAGDQIRIEMLDGNGATIFGAIDQTVRACTRD